VGELDEAALAAALHDDEGRALHLLADLTTATDERLREHARRLAGRILLDRARAGVARRTGAARLRAVAADHGGDLDLDLSMEGIGAARAAGRAPHLQELVARDWGRPDLALCLLVDASGSMTGERLAAAAITAAACTWRAPAELAVVSFAREIRVHRALTGRSAPERVVGELLALRGHGLTAVAGALRAGADQLTTARAARRVTVLLSDCRATDDQDPLPAARAHSELLVIAPADDPAAAEALAVAAGARLATIASADEAPRALARLLDGA
jgi:Mg-chelatase subunit ChlD